MAANIAPSTHVPKLGKRLSKAIMKSQRLTVPKYDLPIRLRPWFLVFTLLIMLLLAFFGFTGVSQSLPLNDKLLHLTCFCIATAVFYFIFDVDEEARRIWFWRHANLIFTAVVCFFFGGFVSELVESLLPHQHFDVGDVVANVIGASVGMYTAYYFEKHYRSRREIARLYRPVSTDDADDLEDVSDGEAGPSGVQLLPLFTTNSSAKSSFPSTTKTQAARFANVWDEREELFGVGDDSDGEVVDTPTAGPPSHPDRSGGPVPTITITRS